MRYQAVDWLHDLDDEPVRMYSEIDSEGLEVRKVEQYRDGRLDVASADLSSGNSRLGIAPIPSLAEINGDALFQGKQITAGEFEEQWVAALEASSLTSSGLASGLSWHLLKI